MPMTYLRKTATYTVLGADGRQLFVDEFESEEHPGIRRPIEHPASVRLLLRNGDRATFVDDRTLEIGKTGEQVTVIHKD